jgi:Mce-associated membrane protein
MNLARPAGHPPRARTALLFGLITTVALASVAGWLGYSAHRSHEAQKQRLMYVQVARQAALNLTTISYTEAEEDVKRILDGATGAFRDDFQKRSAPFIEMIKQAKSTSVGTITAAGLESNDDHHGLVLVAVTVKAPGDPTTPQEPRRWRMRIDVQQVDGDVKVSNVGFVP